MKAEGPPVPRTIERDLPPAKAELHPSPWAPIHWRSVRKGHNSMPFPMPFPYRHCFRYSHFPFQHLNMGPILNGQGLLLASEARNLCPKCILERFHKGVHGAIRWRATTQNIPQLPNFFMASQGREVFESDRGGQHQLRTTG